MENFLLLMNSAIDSWKNPSSMTTVMDMIFAILCGVGLFLLLTPFLKEYPELPPPGSEKNISKVVKRRQNKARKKTDTVEGCRDSQKNSPDIQNASRTTESPIQHPLLDSSPRPFWNSKEKLNQLSLPQLFSYLKVLEALIQKKFNQLLWGISSVFSESVVATAWVARKPFSRERKTVRFSDTLGHDQAPPLVKGPPQRCQDHPLPHQLVTPNLVGMTEIQQQENLPNSRSYQTPSTFQSRACGTTCPTTATGIQFSLPTTNKPCQPGLNWKDIPGCKVQKCQATISQPTESLFRYTLPTKSTRLAFIFPEHNIMVHNHEEPQHEEKAINLGEQQRVHVRFLPSREPAQLQGDSQPNSDGYCKNWSELNQPAQPSDLNSKSYMWNQMVGSGPTGKSLKKVIAKYGIPNTIKKDLRDRVKDLPFTSSSTPGEGLETKNLALRTDEHFMNTTEDLNPKTKMMESNIMQPPMKHRQLPCVSKAGNYSKAALVLEKLHHQDPGGIRVETASCARLRSPLFEQSPPEVQKTQRAPTPIASHGHSRSHPDQWQRYQSVQPHAFCSQAQPQQSRSIQGTGRCILQLNTSPGMSKHEPCTRSEDVASGHSSWSSTTVGHKDRVLPSVAKQTNILKIKEKPPHAWRANVGSGEITNGQALNINLEDFAPIEAKRSQGHLQTPTQQNTGYLHLKTEEYSNNDLKVNNQSQALSVSHHPDGSNTVHPAMVKLPSPHTSPSLQNECQDPKTSQGLGDLFKSSNQSVETQFRVHKDKTETKNDNVFHPSEERPSILKSGGISQGERLGRIKSSISSFTQLKDSANTESKSSLNIRGKREAPSKNSLKNVTWDAAQYEKLSTKLKGQLDSLKKETTPPVTEQKQEVVDKVNLIYSTAIELQSLMDSLVGNLVNNRGDPSELTREHRTKVQECKVESLPFQLGGSSHSSEGLHDPNNSRSARRMSNDHTGPKEQNHPFTYKEKRDRMQAGVDVQRVGDQQLNKVKRGMDFDQHSTLLRSDHPCFYKEVGDKQKSGLAAQRTGDADQIRRKNEIGGLPYKIPEGHHHSSRYTEIRDKQEPGVTHKIVYPQQNVKKGMGHSQLMSPKENHPVKVRGTAAQIASDPDEIRTKSGKKCSPYRSPKMHDHSLRHREVRDKPQPSINAQRTYDQHLNNSKRRMIFDKLLPPKGPKQPCRHRVTGDKQQSSLADQRACDPEQIRRSGMSSCPQRSPNLSFSSRDIREKLLLFNAQRSHDKHPNSVKRRGCDNLPTPKGNNHPQGYRVIEDQWQLSLTKRRICEPDQISKSGMGRGPCKGPEWYNLLYRYGTMGNKQQSGIVHRTCDPYQSAKEGMGRGQPMIPKVSHSAKHRRTGGQDQSGVAVQGVFYPR